MSRHKKDPLRDLTEPERQELTQLSRSQVAPAVEVTGAKVLLAVARGDDYQTAARSVGRRSGDAVSHLVARFNAEGLASLTPRHGGGRRPTYGPEETARIAAEAARAPTPETAVPLSAQDDDGESETGDWEVERPLVTLSDVAGMEAVKRRLNLAFLAPMKNPDLRKLYGKSLRGGLLLYGPPGCGKTFIARATAGELGAKFLSVGLSDVLDMWIGNSEKNLHQIFETARANSPCVLFFDEIDALGHKRSQMRNNAGRNVVNQLLAEMDNVDGNNEGVFILAATNHPWDIDTGLRRPGRLDRTLLVLPPDAAARESVLRLHSAERPLEGVDFAALAAKTEDYSGADLAHLCEAAAELALEDSLATGKIRAIGMSDFKRGLKEVKPSVRPWFETARNYALYANEGGVYDELIEYLKARRIL